MPDQPGSPARNNRRQQAELAPDVPPELIESIRSMRAPIVIAHVVAVAIAHIIALRQTARRSTAAISQIPMTVLMICYTLFGLWLLSAPVAG